ncbi:MAG: ABC transporter ATP-binding protein [Deltaproteobacteria bacterium]|nr:MAG: ABC transporter ATP-binding protein [Deltaproteobacteria bacterium]
MRRVHAGYDRMEVLHGIDLRVEEGEIVTLIGANGAGKTTTLHTICGLVRAKGESSIRLFGEEISRAPTEEIVGRGISMVPEGRRLFPEMTVLENLRMGAFLRRDEAEIRRDLEHVYELFPVLAERAKQQAGSLSGGEQQMCAIGRGLMARPRILLLDEPSLGLAPLVCETIFRTVQRLNEEGTTIFLVEQNANAALHLAHRGYVIETGRITLEDDARALLENREVRQAYLGI